MLDHSMDGDHNTKDLTSVREEPYIQSAVNLILTFYTTFIQQSLQFVENCRRTSFCVTVQKRHSKEYGNPIAPSFYSISPWDKQTDRETEITTLYIYDTFLN